MEYICIDFSHMSTAREEQQASRTGGRPQSHSMLSALRGWLLTSRNVGTFLQLCWLFGTSVLKIRAFLKNRKDQKALELHCSRTDIPGSQHKGSGARGGDAAQAQQALGTQEAIGRGCAHANP